MHHGITLGNLQKLVKSSSSFNQGTLQSIKSEKKFKQLVKTLEKLTCNSVDQKAVRKLNNNPIQGLSYTQETIS